MNKKRHRLCSVCESGGLNTIDPTIKKLIDSIIDINGIATMFLMKLALWGFGDSKTRSKHVTYTSSDCIGVTLYLNLDPPLTLTQNMTDGEWFDSVHPGDVVYSALFELYIPKKMFGLSQIDNKNNLMCTSCMLVAKDKNDKIHILDVFNDNNDSDSKYFHVDLDNPDLDEISKQTSKMVDIASDLLCRSFSSLWDKQEENEAAEQEEDGEEYEVVDDEEV